MKEPKEIFESVSSLPMDEYGIYLQHDKRKYPDESSLEGFDQMRRLGECQDMRNWLHMYRVLMGFKFLSDSTKKHAVVADIGAGYCEMPSMCQTAGKRFNYYCFEFDYKKLKTVSQRKIGNFNRILIRSDLTQGKLPLPKACVDTVVCAEFAEHIGKELWISLLKDISRVCKVGAKAIFTTPNIEAGGIPMAEHIYEYAHYEFSELIEAAGFDIDRKFGLASSLNIRNYDKRYASNKLYKSIRRIWPSQFIKPLIGTEDPANCKEVVLFCTKSAPYSLKKIEAIDFSTSAILNSKRGR